MRLQSVYYSLRAALDDGWMVVGKYFGVDDEPIGYELKQRIDGAWVRGAVVFV